MSSPAPHDLNREIKQESGCETSVKQEQEDEPMPYNPMEMLDQEKSKRAQEDARALLAGFGANEDAPFEAYAAEDLLKNVNVYTLKPEGNRGLCTHRVAAPSHCSYVELYPRQGEPPKKYPFDLDVFQKEAHKCIDNNRSVLVSAHTSAGKTVVATYAIAQCFQEQRRVIYTSPIKALSNQKYRELKEEFDDVGLLTGDVTLNPDATCLVMTTEILRSMHYRGSAVLSEVKWIIFDEVHYMKDKERGVIWEETIILLSKNLRQVYLSATIPNAEEFAKWLAHIKQQPVHVVSTTMRPVPLQHFVFPAGADCFYEVVDNNGTFNEETFAKAMSKMDAHEKSIQKQRQVVRFDNRKKKKRDVGAIVPVIRTIANHDALNCIVFSFSRKECEEHALDLADMDFNTEVEKKMIKSMFDDALMQLSPEDKEMPQIKNILPMLQRGIAVHHAGLMPILKETIELLFAGDYIKVLIATETFALGINMPAKSVVFTSARKFDGNELRFLTSGEYVQMAGRAGRRGKDEQGHVILMVDGQLPAGVARDIITGSPDPLISQFKLSYNTILNLMKVDGLSPDFIIHNSFHQFQSSARLPELNKKLIEANERVNAFRLPWQREMESYVELTEKLAATRKAMLKIQLEPQHIWGFLSPGRLIHIKVGDRDFKWGALHSCRRDVTDPEHSGIILDMIVAIEPRVKFDPYRSDTWQPGYNLKYRRWIRAPFTVALVAGISTFRLRLPAEIRDDDDQVKLDNIFCWAMDRLNHNVPLMHPVTDMNIKTKDMLNLVAEEDDLKTSIEKNHLRRRGDFDKLKEQYERKMDAERELKALKDERDKLKSVGLLEELKIRKKVLEKLGYISENGKVRTRGSIAAELTVSDELVLTEMIMNDAFYLEPAQIVALLSCFVYQENVPTQKTRPEFTPLLNSLDKEARKVAEVTRECRNEPPERDTHMANFNPGMMREVQRWMDGDSFVGILHDSSIFEGTIIRCLRRLEEVLREMVAAAKADFNDALVKKFEKAREMLKRDIVFASSLYL